MESSERMDALVEEMDERTRRSWSGNFSASGLDSYLSGALGFLEEATNDGMYLNGRLMDEAAEVAAESFKRDVRIYLRARQKAQALGEPVS